LLKYRRDHGMVMEARHSVMDPVELKHRQ
jgi:hypothetical protein